MKRKDDVGAIADGKLSRDIDAGLLQRFDFVDQRGRIDDNAVSDDGLNAGPQNAAGNELENEFLIADKDRMAGIVATLVTRDDGEFFGEKVHDLAFALVAPLRAEHNDVSHGIAQNDPLYRAAGAERLNGPRSE